MKVIQIVVEGVSEEQIQKDIERNLRGWKLILQEPKGADWKFMNPFFGHPWDGTSEELYRIISTYGRNPDTGKIRPMIIIFQWNGEDRFAWCSWEKVLYDCKTKIKHPIAPKYAGNITEKIIELCGDEIY